MEMKRENLERVEESAAPPKPPLVEKEWLISPAMYAEILDLLARYDELDNHGRFVAEVASRFGLRPFTHYKIIVDWGGR